MPSVLPRSTHAFHPPAEIRTLPASAVQTQYFRNRSLMNLAVLDLFFKKVYVSVRVSESVISLCMIII